MRTPTLAASLLCMATLVAILFLVSASAQVPPLPPEGASVPPAVLPTLPGPVQPPKKSPQTVTPDPLPEKRNPFWPIRWRPGAGDAAVVTGITQRVLGEVDWEDATKHLKDNARVSKIMSKIIVVFEGQIYEIGQVVSVTRNGNVYTFRLLEGAKPAEGVKLEQGIVRPADQ